MRERVVVYGGQLATGTVNDGGYRVQADPGAGLDGRARGCAHSAPG